MSTLWNIKKLCYRTFQFFQKTGVQIMNYPKQHVLSGSGTIAQIPKILSKNDINNVLLVCSNSVLKSGHLDAVLHQLTQMKIAYTCFHDIEPNPSTTTVERGYRQYLENHCQGIVTIGGGSPMDCAKIIGIRVTNPNISYEDMKNMLKIKHPIPFMIAVPTTAGTGSESTIAAVVTNTNTQDKYPIISLQMMPKYAILDETLTLDLPASITAYTGMDALTHAIEAYIGKGGTAYTDAEALKAIRLIFEKLEFVYDNPSDQNGRKDMLLASNHAANAFTRAYTGYVHTFSHALSGLYHLGHGKTNATILPHMLQYFGDTITKKLATVAVYCNLGTASESSDALAQKVIDKIVAMNKHFEIPEKIEELQTNDIPWLVNKSLAEGNPNCPVPKIMDYEDGVTFVMNNLLKE